MRLVFRRGRGALESERVITPAPAFAERAVTGPQAQGLRRTHVRRRYWLCLALAVGAVVWALANDKINAPHPVAGDATVGPHAALNPVPTYTSATAPAVPNKAENDAKVDDSCEWVVGFTREDGTRVDGHWRSKPHRICALSQPRNGVTSRGIESGLCRPARWHLSLQRQGQQGLRAQMNSARVQRCQPRRWDTRRTRQIGYTMKLTPMRRTTAVRAIGALCYARQRATRSCEFSRRESSRPG
jgi:hypothetical protein